MSEEELEIYGQLRDVTDGIYNYSAQLMAISKWIASEFEKKESGAMGYRLQTN